MDLCEFLRSSYTAYHAAENAAKMCEEAGFTRLREQEIWNLQDGGAYYVVRGGSIVAFRFAKGGKFRIVASHSDSPCLKLKENAACFDGTHCRLNAEGYGGGLWYTFFDRPLALAGRVIREKGDALTAELYTSDFRIVLPSLAIHQNREANEKFAVNLQTELALAGLRDTSVTDMVGPYSAYDLFLVPAEEPFSSGANKEFLTSPRLDDLMGVYTSVSSLLAAKPSSDTLVAACFEAEEIGSGTQSGAGSDFLRNILARISNAQKRGREEELAAYSSSLLFSLDNAHAVHPNHPEKSDPTNRVVLGGGVVLKAHAGGAYTTDGMTAAIAKKIFSGAGVKVQTFYNRSDVRSGSTLGAISMRAVSIPSVDLGVAQLAMHSASETAAWSDIKELEKALEAFYRAEIEFTGNEATVK